MNRPCLRVVSCAAALLGSSIVCAQGGTATYDLTFESTWSAATHPRDFPSNPHYSSLIGGTHTSGVSFWQVGGLATPGIEQMAETGGTGALTNEVNAAINAGTADQVVQLGSLFTSPATATYRFTVTAEYSRLSLVTMLAPSPDWFLGVDSLQLLQGGKWVDSLVVPLHVYDAGTDSGTTYRSPDADTNPQDPIARVTTASGPFQGLPGPVGSFTLTRVASSLVYGCGVNPANSMTVSSTPPQIGQTTTLNLDDPSGGLSAPGATAALLSATADAAFPCGTSIANFGLAAPGTPGELLVAAPFIAIAGPVWNGAPAPLPINVPVDITLVDVTVYFQGVLADSSRVGFADAVELLIGG